MNEKKNVERVDKQILAKIVRFIIREFIVLSQTIKEEKLNWAKSLVTKKQKRVARDNYSSFTNDKIVKISYSRTKIRDFSN